MYIYIYIYTCTYIYIYIYIYVLREREREREREGGQDFMSFGFQVYLAGGIGRLFPVLAVRVFPVIQIFAVREDAQHARAARERVARSGPHLPFWGCSLGFRMNIYIHM